MKIDESNPLYQATCDFYRSIENDNSLITSFSQEIKDARYAAPQQKVQAYRREGIKTPRRRR